MSNSNSFNLSGMDDVNGSSGTRQWENPPAPIDQMMRVNDTVPGQANAQGGAFGQSYHHHGMHNPAAEGASVNSSLPSTPAKRKRKRKAPQDPAESAQSAADGTQVKKRRMAGVRRAVFLLDLDEHDYTLPAGSPLQFTLVEIVALLPRWFGNTQIITRFLNNKFNSLVHWGMLNAHRDLTLTDYEVDKARAGFTDQYRKTMRKVDPAWTKAMHEAPDGWDKGDMTVNQFIPDSAQVDGYVAPSPVPFKELSSGLKKLPQGYDAGDLTRALRFSMQNQKRGPNGEAADFLFPDDLHVILGHIGYLNRVAEHMDGAAIQRYEIAMSNKRIEQREVKHENEASTTPRPLTHTLGARKKPAMVKEEKSSERLHQQARPQEEASQQNLSQMRLPQEVSQQQFADQQTAMAHNAIQQKMRSQSTSRTITPPQNPPEIVNFPGSSNAAATVNPFAVHSPTAHGSAAPLNNVSVNMRPTTPTKEDTKAHVSWLTKRPETAFASASEHTGESQSTKSSSTPPYTPSRHKTQQMTPEEPDTTLASHQAIDSNSLSTLSPQSTADSVLDAETSAIFNNHPTLESFFDSLISPNTTHYPDMHSLINCAEADDLQDNSDLARAARYCRDPINFAEDYQVRNIQWVMDLIGVVEKGDQGGADEGNLGAGYEVFDMERMG